MFLIKLNTQQKKYIKIIYVPLNYCALFWQFACIPKKCQLTESNEHQTNLINNKQTKGKIIRMMYMV